jgi:3-deoxy-D-manno-octulosonate 8-phosphate phosphatase (KDO 8-P phosphatase)
MNGIELDNRLRQIRALALDVDGVLTDGCFWWGSAGEEWKRFCFSDVMGLSLAQRAGLKLGLISGEDSPLVDRYGTKIRASFIAKGRRDKAVALKEFAAGINIDLSAICYMGDDVNDVEAMEMAGVSAAPANATRDAIDIAHFVTRAPGGNGAVRELVEAMLAAKGLITRQIFLTR